MAAKYSIEGSGPGGNRSAHLPNCGINGEDVTYSHWCKSAVEQAEEGVDTFGILQVLDQFKAPNRV